MENEKKQSINDERNGSNHKAEQSEAQIKAAKIRQELSGREHTDSVELLREDRAR